MASGPVILLGIQMEKKIAPSPPSFIRGMSMLPAELRTPRSKSPSRNRCVVSSCVSTTSDAKCSLRARAERSSTLGVAVITTPQTTHKAAPATRMTRSISPRRLPPQLVLRLQLVAHALHLLHHTERVLTQNLPNIFIRISLAQQRFRDLWQLRAVLQPIGHASSVKIGPETYMLSSDQLHGVVDVIHNPLPAHVRQLAFFRQFPFHGNLGAVRAFRVAATIPNGLIERAHN